MRRTPVLILVVVLAVLAGAGVAWMLSSKDDTTPAAQSSPTGAPSPLPSRAKDDFLERSACQLVTTWVSESRTGDYELAQRIADAAKASTPPGIRFEGQMLNDRLELARASLGKADHEKYQQGLVDAAGRLRGECAKLGLA